MGRRGWDGWEGWDESNMHAMGQRLPQQQQINRSIHLSPTIRSQSISDMPLPCVLGGRALAGISIDTIQQQPPSLPLPLLSSKTHAPAAIVGDNSARAGRLEGWLPALVWCVWMYDCESIDRSIDLLQPAAAGRHIWSGGDVSEGGGSAFHRRDERSRAADARSKQADTPSPKHYPHF